MKNKLTKQELNYWMYGRIIASAKGLEKGTQAFEEFAKKMDKEKELESPIEKTKVGKCNLDSECQFTNLDNNPILKELLRKYIIAEYQGDANLSEEYLWMEYNKLKTDNELNVLFIQENLDNTNGFG